VTTGEAVNIGMVFFLPTETLFFKGDLERVKALFPQVTKSHLVQWLNALDKAIKIEGIKLRNTEDILPTINYPTSTYFGDDIAVALNLDALPPDFEKKYIERLVAKSLPFNNSEP
jgi:hypothetical protein